LENFCDTPWHQRTDIAYKLRQALRTASLRDFLDPKALKFYDALLDTVPLLAESDIVVLCIPLSAGTVHFINADRLALMKRGALLVNPARGSLVDEKAVAAALAEDCLGGYAADAFGLEDLSRADRPREIPMALLAHPHTLFSAHIGSATIAARQAIEARAAENILDALTGHAPRDAINTIARQTR
jgi:phosphonate dehydrogenase